MITNRLRFLTAGESHGPALTAILEGLPAGLPFSSEIIDRQLKRRQQGYGAGLRMAIEEDRVEILAGVLEGKTNGAPLALKIDNLNHARWQGQAIEPFTTPRPGHADLTGTLKYGYQDLRPALERASARETAARVAVGAACRHLLQQFNITICGYVTSIGTVSADLAGLPLETHCQRAEESPVRCPDPIASVEMEANIRQAMIDGDTLGGIIEVLAMGLPPGLGSHVHWDRRLEARLGAAVLSVQAIKGVEFGPAFENTRLPGTQVQDAIQLAPTNSDSPGSIPDQDSSHPPAQGKLQRSTWRAGGLEGGITTGGPLVIRAAMKPIATTIKSQGSVDLATGKPASTHYERSDYCPVPRAVPILEAMVAFILADALLEKLGGDSMEEIMPRFQSLRQAYLDQLPMDNHPHIFWPT